MTSRVPALVVRGLEGRLGWAHTTPLMPIGFMAPGHDIPMLTF